MKVLDLDRDGVVRWRGRAGGNWAEELGGGAARARAVSACCPAAAAPSQTKPTPRSPACQADAPTPTPTTPPPPARPPAQISAGELASAMGFLREQMGEEELRALLETLSVEAGACVLAGAACRAAAAAGCQA